MKPNIVLLVIVLACASMAQAQTQTQQTLANALANQARAALTGGATASDAMLVGTVTWIAGATYESGTVTLKAKGTGKSRVDSTVDPGPLGEIRNNGSSDPQCWSKAKGSFQAVAVHNCWTDASWFFPALTSLVADPSATLSYIGQESRNGTSVQHVRAQRLISGQRPKATALIARLSTTDYYLDASTYLPVAIAFNTHPENDLNVDLAAEVRYSDYHMVNGIKIPFRVKKFINGALSLDLSLTSAAVNSGLQDSEFAVQ